MYNHQTRRELQDWQRKMRKGPSWFDHTAKKVQDRMNRIIPEKVHGVITATIKQMVKGVLFGAKYTVPRFPSFTTLMETEAAVKKQIEIYRNTAVVEGGVAGAGGFLLGVAEFPVLMATKLKLLFDIATIYGYDVKEYPERVYLLNIFQLAYSSPQHRKKVFEQMVDWNEKRKRLPEDINAFDWRSFQQEYRDHIDLAKIAQLIPGIGAVVGVVVNYRLLNKLGTTAMNAYRMRYWADVDEERKR